MARALGITQKSAGFLLHRIRYAMQSGSMEKMKTRGVASRLMNGPVEVDETYVGGKEKNKHKDKKQNAGRGTVGKEDDGGRFAAVVASAPGKRLTYKELTERGLITLATK